MSIPITWTKMMATGSGFDDVGALSENVATLAQFAGGLDAREAAPLDAWRVQRDEPSLGDEAEAPFLSPRPDFFVGTLRRATRPPR